MSDHQFRSEDFPIGLVFSENGRIGPENNDYAHSLGDIWLFGLEPGLNCEHFAEAMVIAIDSHWIWLKVMRHHHTKEMPNLTRDNGILHRSLN